MYLYLYDDFVQDRRYEKELAAIEARLTDLDIFGKVIRLAMFRRIEDMIRDELRRGVATVVIVGNDHTVFKVLDSVPAHKVAFGIIPLGPRNTLARMLGIPAGVEACDILAARIIEALDVGVVNGHKFLTGIRIPPFQAEMTCEGQYRILPPRASVLEIRNMGIGEDVTAGQVGNPCDGMLEVVLHSKASQGFLRRKKNCESVVPLKNLSIHSLSPIVIYADGEEMVAKDFEISVEPAGLRFILGRARMV